MDGATSEAGVAGATPSKLSSKLPGRPSCDPSAVPAFAVPGRCSNICARRGSHAGSWRRLRAASVER
ncbi:MAG TPA: hypothetical protein VF621_20750 [Pyrinomonadaceae bacterium]